MTGCLIKYTSLQYTTNNAEIFNKRTAYQASQYSNGCCYYPSDNLLSQEWLSHKIKKKNILKVTTWNSQTLIGWVCCNVQFKSQEYHCHYDSYWVILWSHQTEYNFTVSCAFFSRKPNTTTFAWCLLWPQPPAKIALAKASTPVIFASGNFFFKQYYSLVSHCKLETQTPPETTFWFFFSQTVIKKLALHMAVPFYL